jgi:hypothetical protein
MLTKIIFINLYEKNIYIYQLIAHFLGKLINYIKLKYNRKSIICEYYISPHLLKILSSKLVETLISMIINYQSPSLLVQLTL